ncbi:MAG: MipA/OmpV family protein [Pseudomonadota bacterium]
MIKTLACAALLSTLLPVAAYAQSPDEPAAKEPRRVRVGLGARIVPTFLGSAETQLSPYWDFAVTRGSKPFEFEAADESFGFPLLRASGFEFGPAASFEGSRRRKETGVAMDEVGFTVEAGGFAQLWLAPALRVRTEVRKGIGGHRGWVGSAGADYVIRDGDRYDFSVGPRVRLSDRTYQEAYFGVNAREAAATGLSPYRPGPGVHSVGAVSGMHYSLGGRWGLVGYARYDRLVGDAARSPFIRTAGKRDQLSGGLGLSYIFGRR